MDLLVISLGLARDRSAVAPLIEKVRQLDRESPCSHCRAVAMALEALGDPAAAPPLADLLRMSGMIGHAITTIDEAREVLGSGGQRTAAGLNRRLREMVLARALYRCGGREGLGEAILRQYREGLCGHFARHADAILRHP